METNSSKNTPPKIPGKSKKPKIGNPFYWVYIALLLGLAFILFYSDGSSTKEINVSRLEQILYKGDQSKIVVVKNKDFAEISIKKERIEADTSYKDLIPSGGGWGKPNPANSFYIYKYVSLEGFEKEIARIESSIIARDTVGKTDTEKQQIMSTSRINIVPEERSDIWKDILSLLWPLLLLVFVFFFFTRMMRNSGGGAGGGGIFSIGKSKAQMYDKDSRVKVTFKDVAGLEEAKVEIMEIVDFLKNPQKYTSLGGKIPKGALLVGPPGTGKTLLAKAVAGEAKVPFFSMSGSDFMEMFVGVGASRVRDLFKTAKEKAPCIIFIDEIDAIGRARGKSAISGSNDERENTLNQLLTEMDGFGTNAGVIILAATNRADVLDKALLRAGRFDRQIYVELPDLEERKEIFVVHMRNLKLDIGVDKDFLAKQTPGFSGADIANVCNEAALIAARRDKQVIEKQDFLDAIDRIVGGLEKRSKIITPHEKRVIAYHESGHATVSWLLRYAHPLVKVTIVPRGKSLGAAWYLPEERQITTTEQLFDEITATLGGRAAEQLIFNHISTGALNDLEKVTKQAFAMTAYYGLNKKIGNVSYYDSTGQSEYNLQKPFSEKTAETIDEEVSLMIESAYKRALTILTENKENLDKLAQLLITREVIFREDLEEIFGKRPFEEETIVETVVAGKEEEKSTISEETVLETELHRNTEGEVSEKKD